MQSFAQLVANHFESTADLYWDNTRRAHVTARFCAQKVAVTLTFEQT
ncbi:MAG TPA: hypothetical protein VEX68_30065 [Bryobacteraceae bacterium]|nr:hypothetical protein [Bryobacteraceae bacterium]